jgi:hypothetical protein
MHLAPTQRKRAEYTRIYSDIAKGLCVYVSHPTDAAALTTRSAASSALLLPAPSSSASILRAVRSFSRRRRQHCTRQRQRQRQRQRERERERDRDTASERDPYKQCQKLRGGEDSIARAHAWRFAARSRQRRTRAPPRRSLALLQQRFAHVATQPAAARPSPRPPAATGNWVAPREAAPLFVLCSAPAR